MRTIKLIIEYDGTDFAGWQIQPRQRTVQGDIELSLKKLLREDIKIVGSGRTDAGVHALGQVASFRTSSEYDPKVYQNGLNKLLSRDVRIIKSEIVPVDFNARRNAVKRSYRYCISKKDRAIGRQYNWYPRAKFQSEPMIEASACLIGEYDFTSFSKSADESGSCSTIVYDIRWSETDEKLIFEIDAIRFLYNMIRIIIGTLMDVGRGKISGDKFNSILNARDRKSAGNTAPPHGLYLLNVDYREDG